MKEVRFSPKLSKEQIEELNIELNDKGDSISRGKYFVYGKLGVYHVSVGFNKIRIELLYSTETDITT